MKVLVVDGILPPARPVYGQHINLVPEPNPAAAALPKSKFDRRLPVAVAALLLFAMLLTVARLHPIKLHLALPFNQATTQKVAVAQADAEAAAPAPAPKPAAPAVHIATNQELAANISAFLQTQNVPYYVVVKDLKNGQTFTSHDGDVITSASLYKLFVANQTYRMIDQGAWTYGTPAGDSHGRTIEQCLHDMITVSDNDCGEALGGKLGWQQQQASLAMQGYSSVDWVSSPVRVNAHDVALLLENLYRGTFLSAQSQANFISLLKQQQSNDRLPQGLPAGTPFAHKTGELNGYMHDAGIVFGPKSDYIIVAMAGPWPTNSASFAPDAQLSQIVYNTLEK